MKDAAKATVVVLLMIIFFTGVMSIAIAVLHWVLESLQAMLSR